MHVYVSKLWTKVQTKTLNRQDRNQLKQELEGIKTKDTWDMSRREKEKLKETESSGNGPNSKTRAGATGEEIQTSHVYGSSEYKTSQKIHSNGKEYVKKKQI